MIIASAVTVYLLALLMTTNLARRQELPTSLLASNVHEGGT
jgi:hypothetical protein